METHTYWASIGRNVTYWRCSDEQTTCPCDYKLSSPLDDKQWDEFQAAVYDIALEHPEAEVLDTVPGHSSSSGWGDEDTYLVLVNLPAAAVPALRSNLARLARRYGQEAIGLVGGPGETLVPA